MPILDLVGLRPTTDRVRETLFNWLMFDIAGATCLDLFAGTGVLGFECLSRGAASVELVERDASAAKQLEQSLQSLASEQEPVKAKVVCVDAISYLKNESERQFDIVFLDPPFDSTHMQSAIDLLDAQQWLAEGAYVYLEFDSNKSSPRVPDNWQSLKKKRMGQSRVELFKVQETTE